MRPAPVATAAGIPRPEMPRQLRELLIEDLRVAAAPEAKPLLKLDREERDRGNADEWRPGATGRAELTADAQAQRPPEALDIVELALHLFPDSIAIWLDNHTTPYSRVLG